MKHRPNPTIQRLVVLASQYEERSFFYIAKARRLQKKMTQAELAEKIGVGQDVIAKFENGRANPTLSFLKKMAKALDAEFKFVY